MAKSKRNVLTHGLSGTMGDLMVFRQLNGETIVANFPKERTAPLTEKQKQALARFKKATVYGKSVKGNEELRAMYQAKVKSGQTAYLLAVTDYLTSPVVEDADLRAYKGVIGDKIKVNALDDFQVKSVAVSITSAADELIEEGNAVQNPMNDLEWTYTVKVSNATLAGTKVSFTASDLPGNGTILTSIIS